MTLTPDQVTSLRTSAGLSAIPPAPSNSGSNNILAQRKQALGMDTPSTPITSGFTAGQDMASAFKGGISEIKDSIAQGRSAKNVGDALESGLTAAEGIVSTVASPLAPLLKPISEGISALGDKIGNNPALQKYAMSEAGQKEIQAVTDLRKLSVAAGAAGGIDSAIDTVKALPKTATTLGQNATDLVKGAGQDIADGVNSVKGIIGKAKEKIVPTESVDTTVGKVMQGKASDIKVGKAALAGSVVDEGGNTIAQPMDVSNVKTYKDLSASANNRITELSKIQDERLAQDTTPRKIQQLALEQNVNGKTLAHNYVKDAIDQLEELYQKTNDPVNLQKIQDIKAKLDPIKGTGISLLEVNKVARQYGSEFGSKAFSKTGDPLTSVNSQAYENTRMGVKNTVRNLLPDDVSRNLDSQMTDTYRLRDLSNKMSEAVQKATQRLQNKNIFQKVGGVIGRVGKMTGAGDVIKELTGLGNTPGASSMSPIEIETKLSKNLQRITSALGQDDAGFVSTIRDIINHPK